METYKAELAAIKTVQRAMDAVWEAEEGSPAWIMLLHARAYIQSHANAALRGK